MLAGGEQRLNHLAMQVVGDDNAHGVDVAGTNDRLPVRLAAGEVVAAADVFSKALVHIRDSYQANLWPFSVENG